MVWPNTLARHFQAQVIQARERAQVGAIKGSIGHVEVFQVDGVGISIIERPRPLPGHDTPNPTQHPYTLKCEEPDIRLDSEWKGCVFKVCNIIDETPFCTWLSVSSGIWDRATSSRCSTWPP